MKTENRPEWTKHKLKRNHQTVWTQGLIINHKIIQWNCPQIKANRSELLLLVTKLSPAIICLQETFLKENGNINIKSNEIHNHIDNTGDRASGRVSQS